MSYSTGEALILTRVIACDNFDANNTSRGDWGILNRGKSDHYAILRPGAFAVEWISPCSYNVTWTTYIEVWQRWKDDAQTRTDLYARIADLLPIMAYPHLGSPSTILDATFEGADEPQDMWTKSGGPAWLRWRMAVKWKEQVNVTLAE